MKKKFSVPVPTNDMKQIGLDFCSLSAADGFHYSRVSIHCISNWTKVNPIKNKVALTVVQVLYDLISCLRYCKIHTKYQDRKFVNLVLKELHALTEV